MSLIKKSAIALIIAAIALMEGKSASMSMTSAKEGEVEFRMAGTGTAVIDWGDGSTPETITFSAYDKDGYFSNSPRYTHTFRDTIAHTIIIDGQNITRLYCNSLQLTALDVSNNTALKKMSCHYNQLTNIDVSKNTALTELTCRSNNLTSFNVSTCTALTYLDCGDNQLTSLDVSKNTALTSLNCEYNDLTVIDVSKNTALTKLVCFINNLTILDVSKNTALGYLHCSGNQLKSLDVTKNTALTKLNCEYNDLTILNVSNCTVLKSLDCHDNQLTAEVLTALFGMLHANPVNEERYVHDDGVYIDVYKTIHISGNPGYNDCDRSITTDKGWVIAD